MIPYKIESRTPRRSLTNIQQEKLTAKIYVENEVGNVRKNLHFAKSNLQNEDFADNLIVCSSKKV